MLSASRLIGFAARRAAVAGLSFTYVGAGSVVNAANVSLPAGAQAGDFAVLFDSSRGDTAYVAEVYPSGFTEHLTIQHTGNTDFFQSSISSGLLSSTHISDGFLTGVDAALSLNDRKVVLVFRPSIPIASIVPSTPTGEATGNNPASQSIAMSGQTPPVIGLAMYYANVAVDPRTFTAAADGEETSSSNQYVKYKIYNPGSTPANHTIDMDDEGQNHLAGIYFTFTT